VADFLAPDGIPVLPEDLEDLRGTGARQQARISAALRGGEGGPFGYGLRPATPGWQLVSEMPFRTQVPRRVLPKDTKRLKSLSYRKFRKQYRDTSLAHLCQTGGHFSKPTRASATWTVCR